MLMVVGWLHKKGGGRMAKKKGTKKIWQIFADKRSFFLFLLLVSAVILFLYF
jgi:hypothetical protein